MIRIKKINVFGFRTKRIEDASGEQSGDHSVHDGDGHGNPQRQWNGSWLANTLLRIEQLFRDYGLLSSCSGSTDAFPLWNKQQFRRQVQLV